MTITTATPTSIRKSTHWIGPVLRDLRNAAGLSLSQLAAKSGAKEVVVGSYERGDRRPTVERADALLATYGKRLAVVNADDNGNRQYGLRIVHGDGSEHIDGRTFISKAAAEMFAANTGARDDGCHVEIVSREVGPWVAVEHNRAVAA